MRIKTALGNALRSRPVSSICRRSYTLANLLDMILSLPGLLYLISKGRTLDPYSQARIIGIGQIEEEIKWVADIIRKHQPQYLLELGTQKGGNAFFLSHYMPENGTIITVDVAPRIIFDMARSNYRRKEKRKQKAGIAYGKFHGGATTTTPLPLYLQFSIPSTSWWRA